MPLRHLFSITLFLATFLGCQSTPTLTLADHPADAPLTPTLPPNVPTLSPDDPASLALPRYGRQTYRLTAGPNANQIAHTQTRPSPYDPFVFQTHTVDNRIEYLNYDERGAPVLVMTEDLHHKAATFYDPPVPVIPAGIQPGETQTFNTHLTVLGLHNPALVRDSGDATVAITHDGTEASNGLTCRRFTTKWEIKLGLASVSVNTVTRHHPDHGLVALTHDETINVLFFPIRSNWAMELEDTRRSRCAGHSPSPSPLCHTKASGLTPSCPTPPNQPYRFEGFVGPAPFGPKS